LLDIRNLCLCAKKDGKEFGILNNISFSVGDEEILGIAGESGCGKSMTAMSVTNLLPPSVRITSGEIIYKKNDLTSLSEKELRAIRGKEISCIFQDVRQALNPLMKTGRQITETLELGRQKTAGRKQKEEDTAAALELLASLGFNEPRKIFDAYPHQLSGGMCQRVMTAIAVINNPKLLLADEPSSSLDEESQKKCLSLLLEMNQKKKTGLIVISHDLSIIQNFCRRFLIMYAGRIIEEGPAETLFSPLHPYTMALVNALAHKDKRGKNLENIPGKIPSIEDQLQGCPFAPRCGKARSICKETFPPDFFLGEETLRKVYCYYPEGDK